MCCGRGKSSSKGRSRLVKKRPVQTPVISGIMMPEKPIISTIKIEEIIVNNEGKTQCSK